MTWIKVHLKGITFASTYSEIWSTHTQTWSCGVGTSKPSMFLSGELSKMLWNCELVYLGCICCIYLPWLSRWPQEVNSSKIVCSVISSFQHTIFRLFCGQPNLFSYRCGLCCIITWWADRGRDFRVLGACHQVVSDRWSWDHDGACRCGGSAREM